MSKIITQEDFKSLEAYNYLFAALRGIQAGKEFYVAMCPLKLIPRIFVFNEEEVPPELRSQRTLNRSRIPRISNYLVDNPEDFVFSSLTVSIDGDVIFRPIGDGASEMQLGYLIVPMTAQFLINDGQHRRAAIEAALKERPELGAETISVVFFVDAGLKRSQQMFADLNQHAVRPTRSLSILYNHRDEFSRGILRIIDRVPIFRGLTELEKSSISNRSMKVFTLSAVYQAMFELLGGQKKPKKISKTEEDLAVEFWTEIMNQIPEWKLLSQKKVSSFEIRKEYVHVHGIILHSLGIVGNTLLNDYRDEWNTRLEKLQDIDWSRSNSKVWEGRAMIGGRMNKTQMNLALTVNYLKKKLELPLTDEESRIENEFWRGNRGKQ